jgi:hypothetical protein
MMKIISVYQVGALVAYRADTTKYCQGKDKLTIYNGYLTFESDKRTVVSSL